MNKEQAEPGPGRDEGRQEKPRQPLHGQVFVTRLMSVVSEGCYISTVSLIKCFHSVRVGLGEYKRLSLACPHVIPAIVATYLRKRSTG